MPEYMVVYKVEDIPMAHVRVKFFSNKRDAQIFRVNIIDQYDGYSELYERIINKNIESDYYERVG